MLYFLVNVHTNRVDAVVNSYILCDDPEHVDLEWMSRHEFRGMSDERLEKIAESAEGLTGKKFLTSISANEKDICMAPAIGDEVSKTFNGDSYPCGVITKIAKNFRYVETSTGDKFYRVKTTAGFRLHKTWWLIGGHHDERNPHI